MISVHHITAGTDAILAMVIEDDPEQEYDADVALIYDGFTKLTEAQAEGWYEYQRGFWANRDQPEEMIAEVMEDYAEAFKKPPRTEVVEYIKEQGFSNIMELGGAVGGLYNALDDFSLRYFNAEPYRKFIDRQQEDFPWTQAETMDAEVFAITAFTPFPDLFFSSVALCMTPPRLCRAVLKKAAEITDDIIIWDYAGNSEEQVSEGPVLYTYNPNSGLGFNFAHPFELYFEEIGFELIHKKQTQDHALIKDHCIFHARDRSAN